MKNPPWASRHLCEPDELVRPVLQSKHEDEAFSAEYFPAEQGVHELAVLPEYCPGGQASQEGSPGAEYRPTVHAVQSVMRVLPAKLGP